MIAKASAPAKKTRSPLRILWDAYVTVGTLFMGVRVISFGTWFMYHSWGALFSSNVPGPHFGTIVMSILGFFLAGALWPLGILTVAVGKAALLDTLFFPWFV